MASQSGNPTTAIETSQNSATGNEQQDDKAKVDKPTTSVFINSEPMREEQVQNAVKFLSHPKVRVSPVMYRRSFLEKKGLTKEEIDEAFRRVPDPPSTAVAANVSPDGQVKSPSYNQPQASIQTLQPAAAATGVVPSSGSLKQSKFHWSHVIIAVGLLSISGAGTTLLFKKKIIPKLKSWIRKAVKDEENELVGRESSKPSLEEDAAAAAKAAAEAAADVAKATQEMLKSKYDDKRNFEEFVSLLNAQLLEMKSLTSAIQNLEGQRNVPGRASFTEQEYQVNVTHQKLYANGKIDYNSSTVKSSSVPISVEPSIVPNSNSISVEPSIVPNSNSYMEQPWEVHQVLNSSNLIHQSQRNGNSTIEDNGSVPWWQQQNVRITEMDNEDNLKAGSSVGNRLEQPIKRSWVPPQPPPVVMPEAAEAIRRPKSTVQAERLADNQLVTPPDTSGEIVEGSSGMNSSEIQEEE